MIAAISMMRRKPDISVAEFRKHWLDPHGVLTAGLPGTRYYVQHHVIESAHTNALAKKLELLGFPELWYDSYEARKIAYTSPRIAECNIDSEQFVGQVKRLVTEPTDVMVPPKGGVKVFIFKIGDPIDAAFPDAYQARVLKMTGVTGYRRHVLLEQAKAPNSKIPELVLSVAGLAEVTFADEAALVKNKDALVTPTEADRFALYVVEDYVLV